MAEAGGALPFHRYMAEALYAPGLGYYAAGPVLGEGGDFVTAPELSPLFGRCLARTVAVALEQAGGGVVLEAGAGSGALAVTLLGELQALGALPEAYLILELSPALRARQEARLALEHPTLATRVRWLQAPPERLHGVVVANELLDALPCHRFLLDEEGAWELGVTWEGGRFAWARLPLEDTHLAQRVRALAAGLPRPYASEVGLVAETWVRTLGQALERGLMLLIDYGFPRHEYYHPQRAEGTLMCHYRHRAHPDPLVLVGLQDLTAHVDFTALAEAGVEAGLEVAGFTPQGAFLADAGLGELLTGAPEPERLRLAQAAKRLTLPHEMGELFKVLALRRGPGGPLPGFRLLDHRPRL